MSAEGRILFRAFFLSFICLVTPAGAQPEDLTQIWPAQWIKAVEGPERDFGVFYFRRTVEFDSLPGKLPVHTSGDNRYQLFVNGKLAVWGPQRCIPDHWKYETTDIGPFLQKGRNVLAVVVWNYGAYPPDAQFTVRTAFILAAGEKSFRMLNSGPGWKAVYDPSYSAVPPDRTQISGYFGAGATERLDGNRHIWDWELPGFDDGSWPDAVPVENGQARTCIWAGRWKLEPREIAMEKIIPQRFQAIRLAEGTEIPAAFPASPCDVHIAPHSSVRLVFDQGFETTAFPELEISGGRNAYIRIKYAEAPCQADKPDAKSKGNRGEVEGKNFFGVYDEFIADGGAHRIYRPLWWRAFRYVEMTISTKTEPLTIHDYRNLFNTYPFEQKAKLLLKGENLPVSFETIAAMLETGERTIRLCSHETIMDCPYYEQTQFEGDSRVQALVSYYNFGDPALARNAIIQFSWSLNEQGFLSARYPANSTYYIPNFSIFWVGMLYDYMMHAGDEEFIRQNMQGVRTVLWYFLQRQRVDGTIRRPGFHNFVDWAFPRGEAPSDEEGYSALADLHVLLALQWAAELEAYAGEKYFEKLYREKAASLTDAIREQYWQEEKGLYSDTRNPEGPYSVHASSLAVLTGIEKGEAAKAVMHRALNTEGLTRPTIYWNFYLFEALDKAGLGTEYLAHTGPWQEMLKAGCTTWPETGLQSRSECHGWGASPNYHLYKIILGVRPAKPGFSEAMIVPSPGKADEVSGQIPHPQGKIIVKLISLNGKNPEATITLPENITGIFRWKGREYKLKGGLQTIKL